MARKSMDILSKEELIRNLDAICNKKAEKTRCVDEKLLNLNGNRKPSVTYCNIDQLHFINARNLNHIQRQNFPIETNDYCSIPRKPVSVGGSYEPGSTFEPADNDFHMEKDIKESQIMEDFRNGYVPLSDLSTVQPAQMCIHCGQTAKPTTLLEELHNSRYYKNVDRNGAIRLLKAIPNLSDGAFLMRPSNNNHFFVLTVYKREHFYHVVVENDVNGNFFNHVEQGTEIKFKSVKSYIEYHILNGITIRDKANYLHILLKEF